jgi:hypothetical protein
MLKWIIYIRIMFDKVFDWIWNHVPWLAAGIILVAVTWFVCLKYFRYKSRIDGMEDACNKIPGHHARLSNVETKCQEIPSLSGKVDGLLTKIDGLTVSLDRLNIFLRIKHNDLPSDLVQSQSPLSITQAGMDLLNDSGGRKYVDDNLSDLLSVMESFEFKSALDAQEKAISLIIDSFMTDGFIHIRNYMFHNPTYKLPEKEIPINAASMYQLMGLYLRDRYFDVHPELKEVE